MHFRGLYALVTGVLVFIAGFAVAQDESLVELRQLAEQGHIKSQVMLGFMYDTGLFPNVPQDYAKAAKWYRMAAEQGNPVAQTGLGEFYEQGKGVPQDYGEARKWYRLAAEQGHSVAQYSLALMYSLGRGVPQDQTEAARRFRIAAEQGNAKAQLFLGLMYVSGMGVSQDDTQAYAWLNIAAAQGKALGKQLTAEAVDNRDLVAERMTPETLERAQKLSREYWDTHVVPFES